MSKNESGGEDTWCRMTAKQRHEHKYKIWAAIYLLGCVLLYFGIPQSLIALPGTHKLTYQPEKNIFLNLFNAAIDLTRPVILSRKDLAS